MSREQIQEQTWWQSVQRDDNRRAFDCLYLCYWEKLYGIAWNRTKDEEVAKDMVQEVFVHLWENRQTIFIKTGIGQYLTGVLKYVLIDYFQSERAKQGVLDQVYRQVNVLMEDPSSGWSFEDVEHILDKELERMPVNMRKSFLLRLDHYSTPDIAKRLNLAEQTVSNLLTEANKRLRKNLPHRFQEKNLSIAIAFLSVVNDLLTKN